MNKKNSREKLKNLVPHPRYGSEIRVSEYQVKPEVVRESFWRYSLETIFPETAIPADIGKQNYSMYPRPFYVDALIECHTCHRNFIFFAEEQRYWHEELNLYVDAWCLHCFPCRQKKKVWKARMQRYSDLIVVDELGDEQLASLAEDAVFLWSHGSLKNEHNLRRINNLATRQIPNHESSKALKELVKSL